MRPIFERRRDDERPLKDTIGERQNVSIQTRALRGCDFDDDHFFFLFFSLCRRFLLCQSTHARAARPSSCTLSSSRFFSTFLSLGGICLSLSKVIACGIETTPPPTTRYEYGTRRQRRKRRNDEKEPTDEKASSSTKPFASRAYPIHKY